MPSPMIQSGAGLRPMIEKELGPLDTLGIERAA